MGGGLLGRLQCRISVIPPSPSLLLSYITKASSTQDAKHAYISLYRLVCTHIVWFVVRMNVDLRRMAALNVDNNAFSSL